MKKLITGWFLCNIACAVSAQQIAFEKYYDFPYAEAGYCVQQTNDGGYIIAGRQGIAIGVSKIVLMKTDQYGVPTWTKFIGDNSSDRFANSIQQTSDGGYIITGQIGVIGSQGNVYLVKTDANGDTVWTKNYGGSLNDEGNSVQQTSDGGYVIGGMCNTNSGAYIIKTDALGDTLWTKKYPGIGNADAQSIQQTLDGGYIACGATWNGNVDNQVFIIKMTTIGDTSWTKIYGNNNADAGLCVQQTSDNGYIIAGSTQIAPHLPDYDIYLIKTDANGDTVWTKSIGDTEQNTGRFVIQCSDGGYILTGSTTVPGQAENLYLVKTNSSGDTIWTKMFGGNSSDDGYCVRQTADGGFIVCGSTSLWGASAVYLIKTDSVGYAPTGIETDKIKENTSLRVYPNPFASKAMVRIDDPLKDGVIELFDLTGQMVTNFEFSGSSVELSREGLQSGIYLVRVLDHGELIATQKVIIQ